MENKIFYSWQSSLPNKDNRNFIESCLKKAIKGTNGNLVINYSIDKDTFNEFGSPDIPNTILKKIDNSIFFIADISITENGCPNSNVLLELGYAISVLGWERIICLFNSKYGNVEELPFDLKFHRISTYHSDDSTDKKRITQIIIDTIKNKNIIADGWISNDILSKQKLDKQIVYILNAICRIYNFETYQYEDLLIDNSEESLSNRLVDRKIIGFYVFKKFDNVLDELEILTDSTNPFFLRRNIKSTISSLILFIKEFEYFCSERQNPKLFLNTFEVDDDYKVVHGSELNKSNKDGYILFEKYDLNHVKVIDFGSIHGIKQVELSTNYIVLNKIFIKRYNYYIFKIIKVIKQYLEQFDSILDIDLLRDFDMKKTQSIERISKNKENIFSSSVDKKIDLNILKLFPYEDIIQYNYLFQLIKTGMVLKEQKNIEYVIQTFFLNEFNIETDKIKSTNHQILSKTEFNDLKNGGLYSIKEILIPNNLLSFFEIMQNEDARNNDQYMKVLYMDMKYNLFELLPTLIERDINANFINYLGNFIDVSDALYKLKISFYSSFKSIEGTLNLFQLNLEYKTMKCGEK